MRIYKGPQKACRRGFCEFIILLYFFGVRILLRLVMRGVESVEKV